MPARQQMWNVHEIGDIWMTGPAWTLTTAAPVKYQSERHRLGLKRGSKDKQMGKFGVGLPQATISQARRLEVYTWTSGGPENATFTYIDFKMSPRISRMRPYSGRKEFRRSGPRRQRKLEILGPDRSGPISTDWTGRPARRTLPECRVPDRKDVQKAHLGQRSEHQDCRLRRERAIQREMDRYRRR